MSWITITADHVLSRLAQGELDAVQETGNTTDSALATYNDKLAGILSQVTSMVRGKVASCRDNLPKLGPDGTIPEECLFAACTIARDALVGSLPLSEGATEVRKEELREAYRLLNSVASCEIRIADATGIIPEAAESSFASFGGAALLDF